MVEVPENFSMNPEQLAQMQQQQQPNPLMNYMRQPAIYLSLPSKGEFWAQTTLDMPINGELPVLPMSTRDEIALNTPDALMNGQAVVDMIHSCIPNIRNAWACPSVDLDAILIAIRIASYGEQMNYSSSCPSCSNTDEYEIDLRQFLEMPVDISRYKEPFDYKGMQVYVQPSDYETINLQNLESFEQQRMIRVVDDTTLSQEEKNQRFHEIFRLMTSYTVKNVSGTIHSIVTPDGHTVQDQQHIEDFVTNSERQFFDAVKKHTDHVQQGIPEKIVSTTCDECKHEYQTPFTFDQANFFAYAS